MKSFPLLLVLMAAADTSAEAQTPGEPPSAAMPQPPSPSQVVDRLGKRLSLSDDQKSQMLPIITARQQQMQAVKDDTTLAPRQKKMQVKGIMADGDAKINALLSPDQQKTYAEVQQETRAKMKARRAEAAASQ